MPYLTFRRDMRGVKKDFTKFGKALKGKFKDPFQLFMPTVKYFVWPCLKTMVFLTRKIIDK